MATTTKQHFEQTARVIRAFRSKPGAGDIALEFAREYALDNERFDRVRFLQACGYLCTVDGHITGVQD